MSPPPENSTPVVPGHSASAPPGRQKNRFAVGGLVAVTVVLAAAIGAAVLFKSAERSLDREIAARRAGGEPMLPEDFLPAHPVPDDENAAFHLLRAAADAPEIPYQHTGPQLPLYDAADTRPLTDEQMRLTADEIARHPAALAEARRARACAGADWGVKFATPMRDVGWINLNAQRKLVTFLVLTAVHQHQSGDDPAAVETLRDALAVPRALDRMSLFTPHLVASSIRWMILPAVMDVAEALRVETGDAVGVAHAGDAAGVGDARGATRPDRPASRAQVTALIADLLDEDERRGGIRDSWRGERMEALDAVRFAARQTSPVMAFRLRRDAMTVLRAHDAAIEAVLQPSWAAAKPKLPKAPRDSRLAEVAERAMMMATTSNSFVLEYRLLTDRRVAAVALAAAAYRADHGGRDPAGMDDLVPQYLPSSPADPFAPDGGPLKLITRGDSGPLVYSVAENETDEGGGETLLPRAAGYRLGFPPKSRPLPPPPAPRSVVNVVGMWNSPDAVYHLTHRGRTPEPESEGPASPRSAADGDDEPRRTSPRQTPPPADEPGPPVSGTPEPQRG